MVERFNFIALQEAREFLSSMDKKTRKKVMYNIWKSKTIIDKELFKHLDGNIYEFRTLINKKCIRLFAFWDKENKENTLVVGTHGIYKTTSKVPKSDINKAERARVKYFESKNK